MSFFDELWKRRDELFASLDEDTKAKMQKILVKRDVTTQMIIEILKESPEAKQHVQALADIFANAIKANTKENAALNITTKKEKPSAVLYPMMKEEESSNPAALNSIMEMEKEKEKEKESGCYCAELISDVTFKVKDTKVTGSEKRVKIWRFINSGNKKWPSGCIFKPVNSVFGKNITQQLSPVEANPGQIADCGFQFIPPADPGMYEFKYVLFDPATETVMSKPLVLSFNVVG